MRRSILRRTPMPDRTVPLRRSALSWVPAGVRRRPRPRVDPLLGPARKKCFRRDRGVCRRCGGRASEMHHRRLLGAGGSMGDPTRHRPDKCVSLCGRCHEHVHHNRAQARVEGFIVARPIEPFTVLLRSWEGPIMITKLGNILVAA